VLVELGAASDCPNLDATRDLLDACLAEAGLLVSVVEPGRVGALLAGPPRPRPAATAVLAVPLLAVVSVAAVVVEHRGEQLFEYAGRHPATAHR
jgi:hypothetical protein